MYAKGLTGDEIAARLAVSRDVVYYRLHWSGVQMRRPGLRSGHRPWNKGVRYTAAQKTRMNTSGLQRGRAWNKGKTGIYSSETLRRLRESHTGKSGRLASNWRGGISRHWKRGYRGKQYAAWRKQVFERDNYICQGCGARGGYLTAHHIKPFAKYPELRYVTGNGITLCEDCHSKRDKFRAHFKAKATSVS